MAKQQPKQATKPAPKNLPAKAEEQKGGNVMVLVQDEVPDYLKKEGPGRGNENVGTDDIVIPRLEVVQALSPVVKEGDAAYDENARPGMLMNSVTKQLYGKEVFVVPVIYLKQWLVWKKRKDAQGKALEGGFFGAYPTPDLAEDRAEAEGGEASNIEVIDTPQHLCLLIDANTGKTEEVMLSMPRTKAKISRQWNSMVKLAGGDRFSRVYRIGTQLEKNPKGDFYNFAVSQSGFPAPVLYKRAEELYNTIQAGKRVVKMDVSGFDDGGRGEDPNAEM